MSNIISAKWLKENLNNDKLIIVDCRFSLMDKDYGKRSYESSHIEGAVRIDIEKELSSPVAEHGGRHPLPCLRDLKNVFENKGISNDSIVVAYDDGNLAGPSRLWWILKYLGHDEVYVLNGGIKAFEEIGGKVSNNIPLIEKGVFDIDLREFMKVGMEYVRERLYRDNVIIVDCREESRYDGEFEPVDKKAGHIPNAKNYFWKNILNENNPITLVKSEKELKFYFNRLNNYDEVIVYCGSGITASPVSLVLDSIGIDHKLYSGSFSDWISYEENEVCKKGDFI